VVGGGGGEVDDDDDDDMYDHSYYPLSQVEEPFPSNRRLTTWTPPIPGFDAAKYDLPGAI